LVNTGGSINGSSTDTSVVVNWNSAGQGFIVSVSASNSCGTSSSESAIVDVIDFAVADFSNTDASLTIDFTNFSSSAESYFWDFGDGDTSVEKDPTHKYGTKGLYTVQITATNLCSDSTLTKEISVNYGVGVSNLQIKDINFYPNPASDFILVNFSSHYGWIRLYDASGRLIIKRHISKGENLLDVSHIQPGVFTLVMDVDGEMHRDKLLIFRR
jgi:PKD repeat protein